MQRKLAQLVTEGDFSQLRHVATAELAQSTDESGRNVLMLVADVDPSGSSQFGKCVEYLMHLGLNATTAEPSAGDTAAHGAARRDNLRLLALLPFGAKSLPNLQGATPLMEAARLGSWRCAKHLLHLHRQIRFRGRMGRHLGARDRQGRTAQDLAREFGHPELAELIDRETRINISGVWILHQIQGLTAEETASRDELERLARAGDTAGLQRVATRANCDLPNASGVTALMWAASSNSCDEAALQLLADLGDVTCADLLGDSCLHKAASCSRWSAVRTLVACGAPVNARSGLFSITPLMRAAANAAALRDTTYHESPNIATVKQLLAEGADWSARDTLGGGTALAWAGRFRNRPVRQMLRRYATKECCCPVYTQQAPFFGELPDGESHPMTSGGSGME